MNYIKNIEPDLQSLIGQTILGCTGPDLSSDSERMYSFHDLNLSICLTDKELNFRCIPTSENSGNGFQDGYDGLAYYNYKTSLQSNYSNDSRNVLPLLITSKVSRIVIFGRELPEELLDFVEVLDGKTCDFFKFQMENGQKFWLFFHPFMPRIVASTNANYISGFLEDYGEHYHLVKEIC